MKFRNNRAALAVTVLLAISFVTVLIQFFRGQVRNISHVTTVSAVEYETVDTTIFAVRNEYLIGGVENGYVVPLVGRGERVAKGESIAAVFPSDETARSYTDYLQLSAEIDYYKRISLYSLSQYTDFSLLTDNTYDSLYTLSAQIRRGNFEKVSQCLSDFRSDLTMKQTAAGEAANYGEEIRRLNAQATSCLAAAGQFTSVTATESGYFYPDTDGYENLLSYDDIALANVGDVDGALAAKPAEQQGALLGRLVNSFDWYFICTLDRETANSFGVGAIYEIELPYNAAEPFKAQVYKINEAQGDRSAVVFRVREMNDELASIRSTIASIRLHSYRGLKIPADAIRIVDGRRGVFILRNNIANFRTFDVLYSTETYAVVDRCRDEDGNYVDYVKVEETDENGNVKQRTINCLKLYDEVITEGVDLYDGKLVD